MPRLFSNFLVVEMQHVVEMPVQPGRTGCSHAAASCALAVLAPARGFSCDLRGQCAQAVQVHAELAEVALSPAFFQNEEVIKINGMRCSSSTNSQWLLL